MCQNVGTLCSNCRSWVYLPWRSKQQSPPLHHPHIASALPAIHFLEQKIWKESLEYIKIDCKGNPSIFKERERFCWLYDMPSDKLLFGKQIYCHLQVYLGDHWGRKPLHWSIFSCGDTSREEWSISRKEKKKKWGPVLEHSWGETFGIQVERRCRSPPEPCAANAGEIWTAFLLICLCAAVSEARETETLGISLFDL